MPPTRVHNNGGHNRKRLEANSEETLVVAAVFEPTATGAKG
ncbi:MAG TPA: hypothetical protein VM866_02085 [Pyrinomonadaceae bacterium]|nr:hypothetical protein [Pyrinomonadaceae bacterium]